MQKKILITGSAGFIGMHLSINLLKKGYHVTGIDNLNEYYDPNLKMARLAELGISSIAEQGVTLSTIYDNYQFFRQNIIDKNGLYSVFREQNFDYVIHLAAQAGVRYSITHPDSYIQNNITGFFNILEACREFSIGHFLFASSSSVYGMNDKIPFSTHDNVDQPVSLYAATKKSNELMAYTYSHLYKIPITGMRFFTVYGPWYRPDMAMFLFADSILSGKPVKIFNNGEMKRDFTYIDDVVEAVQRLIENVPGQNAAYVNVKNPFYRILNIGSHEPVNLMDMITILEEKLGQKAIKEFLPMQAGDVPVTYADIEDLYQITGFIPQTELAEGIAVFAEWYKHHYKLNRI